MSTHYKIYTLPLLLLLGALALPRMATASPVRLPVEVMGPNNVAKYETVIVPPGPPIASLWMQAHGLTYADKASVRVGNGPWVSLSNQTVQVAEPGKSYGGIGGTFGTLNLTVPLPQGPIPAGGPIVLAFRFNHTDGTSIGFRVLRFNLIGMNGASLLPASAFVQDDPTQWTAPLPDAADVAAGKALWHGASLVQDDVTGAPAIQAVCADCHTQDGADLHYFNYSNYSIIQRSRFHGLTLTQGKQIASYIRSLPGPAPGRPWNPPYQPGPGLDEKPASEWAAGAGLDAVLPHDADMLPYLFPNGVSKTAIATTGTLNMREMPVAFQMLDWNRWLPTIHPKDAWGDAFVNSDANKMYAGQGTGDWQWGGLRQQLSGTGSAWFIANSATGLRAWMAMWETQNEVFDGQQAPANGAAWTPDLAKKIYSTTLWHLVKSWELMHEFNLETSGPQIYGTGAETRTWLDSAAFHASPAMQQIPETPGLLTSDSLHYEYLTNAWYYTQVVLNSGNRHRQGWNPVDWGYATGRVKDLADQSQVPETLRLRALMVKGMQQADTNGTVDSTYGWFPHWATNPYMLNGWEFNTVNSDALGPNATSSAAVRASVDGAILGAWLDKNKQFTPQQYLASGQANASDTLSGVDDLLNATYTAIPVLRSEGVDSTLLNSAADWGKTVWPAQNWTALKQ